MSGLFITWNFQVIDMFFFGVLGVICYRFYKQFTIPIILFVYGFSEFISYFFNQVMLFFGAVTYNYYFPANWFPTNPLLLAGVFFLIILYFRKEFPFTKRFFYISIVAGIAFYDFIFYLYFFNAFNVWFTHPIAYMIQVLIILPWFKVIKK